MGADGAGGAASAVARSAADSDMPEVVSQAAAPHASATTAVNAMILMKALHKGAPRARLRSMARTAGAPSSSGEITVDAEAQTASEPYGAGLISPHARKIEQERPSPPKSSQRSQA